jgi:hypothetical protein
MRSLFFCFVFLLPSSVFAEAWTGISDCGIYRVKGVARSTPNGLIIVVNEKSKSEINIKIPEHNEAFLAPYVDKAIEASVKIVNKSQGSSVEGIIMKIASRIPNPINPKDTGIKLSSKALCK